MNAIAKKNKIQDKKIIKIFIYLMFFLIPTGLAAFFPLSFNNHVSHGGILFILLLVFGLSVLVSGSWRRTPLDKWVILLAAAKGYAFSLFLFEVNHIDQASFVAERNTFITTIFLYLSFFVITNLVSLSEKQISILVRMYGLGVLLTALLMVYVYYSLGPAIAVTDIFEVKENISRFMMHSRLSNHNNYIPPHPELTLQWLQSVGSTISIGPFLAFCTVFISGYAYSANNKKLLWISLAVILAMATILTASRSGVVALFTGLFVLMMSIVYLRTRRMENYAVITYLIIILILCIFLAVTFIFGLSERFDVAAVEKEPRWRLWLNGLLLILQNPLGIGQRGLYIALEFSNDITDLGYLKFKHNHVHNAFIQFGVEAGLIGLIVISGVFLSGLRYAANTMVILKRYYYQIHVYRNSVGLALGIFSGYAPVFIGMMFESSFLTTASLFTSTILIFFALTMLVNSKIKSLAFRSA